MSGSATVAKRVVPALVVVAVAGLHASQAGAASTAGDRLTLQTSPAAPKAGGRLQVRIADRRRVRDEELCIRLVSPAGGLPCRQIVLPAGGASVRLRAPRPGRWRVVVRGTGISASRPLQVRPRGSRLSVLATGDSLVEPIARTLAHLLQRPGLASVRRDLHYGDGISNPSGTDWRRLASRDVARWRPDVVVLLLGGGERWPLGDLPCCGAPWLAEYSARVHEVAGRFTRGGAAQVYWLTIPATRDADHSAVLRTVNGAIREGVDGLHPLTRVLDAAALLTPGYVYRDKMPIDGRLQTVRLPDGLHLSRPGGDLVARAVVSALKQDGVLPR
jgi:hypothetical protein